MTKVLIITYYWPPSGGAGVQRWLKFVKYLRDFGIEPIIYTHSNGEIPSVDLSLEKDIPQGIEVLKQPIWEPYGFYKKLMGKKSNERINTGFLTEQKKPKRTEGFSIWVRGNFFIPDARKFWIKPSTKFLTEYLTQNKVDAIISTGPPHSMHLIALGIKKQFPQLPWIADFRDPWTNIDFYKDLRLTKWADQKHKRLEKEVLSTANAVLSVGQTLSQELKDLGAKRVITITNGFDEEDLPKSKPILDEKFTIAHIGSMTRTRNPIVLWKALQELEKENSDFASQLQIKLVGKADIYVMETLRQYELEKFLNKIDYIPHQEVIAEQQKSHVLLLVVNDAPNAKGILTGKVFEYLAAQRPILAIAPEDGDLARVIQETQTGKVFADRTENYSALKKHLLDRFAKRHNNFNEDPEKYLNYSRKHLTMQLSEVIKEVVNRRKFQH
jgi:glycosyltransferase involved in cell wall biosynthesis